MNILLIVLLVLIAGCFCKTREGFQGWSYRDPTSPKWSRVPTNRYAAFYMKSSCGKYVSTCARNKVCLVSDMAYADLWSMVPTGNSEHPSQYYIRLWSNTYYMNAEHDDLSSPKRARLVGLHQQPEPFEVMLDKDPGVFYVSNRQGYYLDKDYAGYLRFRSKKPVAYRAVYVDNKY